VALGLRSGTAPDKFLVGLAALNVLAEVAEEGPLLCLVDDAQWLDQASAQVLAFVARRLAAERVALVFALRDVSETDASETDAGETDVQPFTGLPELRLDGLADGDARTLLAAGVHAPIDDVVRERVVAEARGNPLALLELPRSAQQARLAGGFELPDAVSVPRRIEDFYERARAACRSRPSCCCWSRLPSPPARWRCCGALPSDWGSRARRRRPRRQLSCWRSTRACGSAIRWCARRCTERPPHRTNAARTGTGRRDRPAVDPDRRGTQRNGLVLFCVRSRTYCRTPLFCLQRFDVLGLENVGSSSLRRPAGSMVSG
jgi:hypothetical protein